MKLKYFALSAFSLFSLRLIYFGASFSEAAVLLVMAALYGFELYLEDNKKPDVSEELIKQVEALKGNIASLKLGTAIFKR